MSVNSLLENRLGKYIYLHRSKKGMTQKELSEKIKRENGDNISITYLSDIENGKRKPTSYDILTSISIALEIDIDYLYYLSGLFPKPEYNDYYTEKEFNRRMIAFRKENVNKGIKICYGCKREIDENMCQCGDYVKDHEFSEHNPIPMGCKCHLNSLLDWLSE